MNKLLIFIIFSLMLTIFGNVVYAADCGGSIPCNCGDNLTSSRTLNVSDSLTGCSGNGINIATASVTLDCNGTTISGLGSSTGINVSGSNNAVVNNCTIHSFADGINVVSSNNVILANSTIYNITSNGNGIGVQQGSIIADNNNITGVYYGIFSSESGLNITDNEINGGSYGIYLGFNTGTTKIIRNNINGSSLAGIQTLASGSSYNISENNITENYRGLVIGDSYPIIYHNNIYNNSNLSVYGYSAIDLYYNNEGNYWGHDSCPVFMPMIDSNSFGVVDIYAYKTLNGWLIESPVDCPPVWINPSNITPTNYSYTTYSQFNITWGDELGVDKVNITIMNSTNPSHIIVNSAFMTNITIDTYNYSIVLPTGTWNWTSDANDTAGNWSKSDSWTFTINKSTSNPVNLYLNGSLNQNRTYTYPDAVNATGITEGETVYLYRDDVEVASGASPQTEEILLGNSTYSYKVNATGNQNYSDNSTGITYYVLVNKGPTEINLTLNGTEGSIEGSRSYNQYDNATFIAEVNVTGLNISLTSDYPNWTQQNNTTIIYNTTNLSSIGIYNITGYTNGSENYSASSTTYYFDTKGPDYYLNVSPTNDSYYSPNQNYSFYMAVVDASVDTVIFNLYNATAISGGSVSNTTVNPTYDLVNATKRRYNVNLTDLPAGPYNYSWFMNDTLGGNNSTSNITYNIKKADALSISVSPNTAVTSGTSTTVTCSNSNKDAGRSEVNEILILGASQAPTNPHTATLAVGSWAYYCNASNTGNYTNVQKSATIVVSQSSSPGAPTSGGITTTSTGLTPTISLTRGLVNITMSSLTTGGKLIANIARIQDMAIRGMNITVKNNVGNIKITIKKLSIIPSTVSYDISGMVYHYINIEKTNITDSDINVVNFEFAINKTWLTDNNVAASNITMYRWANNRWNDLNAVKITESTQEAFYNANAPGLSVFIIGTTGGAPEAPEAPPTGAAIICEENWQCIDWSECVNKTQTRTCTDANNCGTTANKPVESQECETEEEIAKARTISLLTNVIIIVVAIIMCVLIFLQRTRITSYLRELPKMLPKRKTKKKSTKTLTETKEIITKTEELEK